MGYNIIQLLQEELKKSQQEKELVQQRARLYLADEQLLQSVTSVQQLANMETELEQALERVRARKVLTWIDQNLDSLSMNWFHSIEVHNIRDVSMQSYVSSAYQAATAMRRQQHEFLGNSYQQVCTSTSSLELSA